ncbi:60S ribosomal protein L13a-like [Daphnia pulex]|uniref:60S ribosomal protein L13a-like n=1 Tax=Daphnia pulex TaxID=6669 RepID=UPI001EE02656|nr:60S ribosomal protein L13a-like [Daphnia pulex]XP_046642460.1 60S ribosomal protein L13a-like [Daphnia pulicaria]
MPGFTNKPIIIDAREHLMGRLATIVAKAALNGHKVRVLRAEQMEISGTFFRNKLKFLSFLRKRCNVNPARGPFHHRAPSKIFKRAVRGMLPYKTFRGREALKRVRAFEGVPPRYMRVKKQIAPNALRVICLSPGRKYCRLGRLSHEVGWKYQDIVATLEAKRKIKASIAYGKKKVEQRTKGLAKKKVYERIVRHQKLLQSLGHK